MLRNKRFSLVITLLVMMCLLASCGKGANIPKTYNYSDLSKFITLGKIEGLEYTIEKVKVTKKEIQEKIDSDLASTSTEVEVQEGTVTDTSVLDVNFVGKLNGKVFEGGSANNATVDIANSGYIPGFAEGMVGHQVGETFDINVTFPDNYGADELAGKDAVFTITINSMKERVTPELNDEWVKNNTDFETVEEYEKSVKKELVETGEHEARDNAKYELFGQIVEDSDIVEYPEKELEAAKEDMINTQKDAAESSGLEYEDYIKSQMGVTAEEFEKETVQAYAENTVKQELVLRAIAKELGIKYNKKQYNEFLMEFLSDNNITAEDFESTYGTTIYKYAEDQNLYSTMLFEKVMDVVLENNIAK